MATEQQNHLKSVVEQSQTLVNEINQLEGQAKSKREMLLKLQGIIEYLQQTGVEFHPGSKWEKGSYDFAAEVI